MVILLGPIAIANAQGEVPRASSATESATTNGMLEGGKPEVSTPSTPRASGDTETGGSAKWWDIVKYIVPIVAAMYVSMVTLFEGKGRVLGHVW
jgi:hypothetical protein